MGGPRPPRRLLIVEDDDVLRGRLARAFRERGFEVREAADAASAARQARGEPPTHALVDLRLPETSGLEVVGALVAASREMNVVVLTATAASPPRSRRSGWVRATTSRSPPTWTRSSRVRP